MTQHPFATLLRKLDAEASKAPWEAYECDGPTGFKGTQAEYLRTTPDGFGSGCSAFGILEPSPNFGNVAHVGALYHNGRVRVEEERANARAIVTLRNAAPEVAALVEAAGEAVSAAEYVIALCHDDLKRGRDPSPLVASTPSATLAHAYAAMAFVGELRAALDALRVVATQAKEAK